ncbi:MAG TPA: D-2-hydroxyacid dehydrogenase [Chloroflexota bacterium]|nr:D-2-hydroxyacid dehydrogenase [Chloroflexota bacterium]
MAESVLNRAVAKSPDRTVERPVRMLLVRGSPLLVERLRAVAPRGEFIVVGDAAAGEPYLDDVEAVYMADRLRPSYLCAPRLRWLHIAGAGVDGFSIAGLRDAPFVITHKVRGSVIPMAEHVMAQILLIARRALEYRALQAERRWARASEWPTSELIQIHGKTLGLVGLGHAGLAIARRAKPFGMRVVGVKRTTVDRLPHVDAVYPSDRLGEMLAQVDFVAVTAPLTDQTYHLIGEAELRAMKPTAYLINNSRGPIIDEEALIRALQEGRLAGASLDVFEHEPLDPASPLWDMPNVIVTPHCGGVGPNLAEDTAQEIATNLRRFVAGRPLLYQLNRADIVTRFNPPSH